MTTEALLQEVLPDRFNRQVRMIHHARRLRTTFQLCVGEACYRVTIAEGRIASVRPGPFVMNDWDFSLEADSAVWQQFWQKVPPPGFHDIMALIKARRLLVQGNLYPLMSNLLYFKTLLAIPRGLGDGHE